MSTLMVIVLTILGMWTINIIIWEIFKEDGEAGCYLAIGLLGIFLAMITQKFWEIKRKRDKRIRKITKE